MSVDKSFLYIYGWKVRKTICDCTWETDSHVEALADAGMGSEPIFILYFRRLVRKHKSIFILYLRAAVRHLFDLVWWATSPGIVWRGWGQRGGCSHPPSWPATRWRPPGSPPEECPPFWKEVPPLGTEWPCPQRVCSQTKPEGRPAGVAFINSCGIKDFNNVIHRRLHLFLFLNCFFRVTKVYFLCNKMLINCDQIQGFTSLR